MIPWEVVGYDIALEFGKGLLLKWPDFVPPSSYSVPRIGMNGIYPSILWGVVSWSDE